MKKLLEFKVSHKEKVKENDKEVEKETFKQFYIAKMSRKLADEADLYYGQMVARYLRSGLLSANVLTKRYLDQGDTYSQEEKKEIDNIFKRLEILKKESLELDDKKKKNNQDKKREEEIQKELVDINRKIMTIKQYEDSLLAETAEYKARTKQITWYVVNLSYDSEDNLFFDGETLDDKLDKLEEYLESEDEFKKKIAQKFITVITIWASNRDIDQKGLDDTLKYLDENATRD